MNSSLCCSDEGLSNFLEESRRLSKGIPQRYLQHRVIHLLLQNSENTAWRINVQSRKMLLK
ncbi:hypothetical protein CRYUN_Cryun09bG0190700 [Craigia yunnanensis]